MKNFQYPTHFILGAIIKLQIRKINNLCVNDSYFMLKLFLYYSDEINY